MLKSFAFNQNKITKLFSLQKKKRKEIARTIALMIEELLYVNLTEVVAPGAILLVFQQTELALPELVTF
jgi:hypothetical protein